MNEMIEDIVKKLEKELKHESDVAYDFYPCESDDILEKIRLLEENIEDTNMIAGGDCWVLKWGEELEVILLKRGVTISFYGYFNDSSEQKIIDDGSILIVTEDGEVIKTRNTLSEKEITEESK